MIALTAVGAAAVGYRRGRAGVRAAIALVVGLFSLVIGATSAGYQTITVGASGDDYTGLLLLPAGAVLIGVGLATLWRSRRLDGRSSS